MNDDIDVAKIKETFARHGFAEPTISQGDRGLEVRHELSSAQQHAIAQQLSQENVPVAAWVYTHS